MKKKATTVILILVFFLGLSLLLYPSISDWYNSYHQSRVVVSFAEAVSRVNDEEYREMMDAAQDYNRRLAIEDRLGERLTAEQLDDYESQLDITGTGIMGYIEIHKIRCILPIYHGIDDGVLQIAIGHIPWSSLPIGGAGSHSVLSGHRGLPSARLFTDIDKLDEGDTFIIRTMNKVLTYEVDQIRIVQPNETYDLRIIPGEDLCTLVTCTPYGVNTHRLLVRGHRVENDIPNAANITADALLYKPYYVAPIVAAPILLILFIMMLITTSSGYRQRKEAARKRAFDALSDLTEEDEDEDYAEEQDEENIHY